jgi:predicted nucleic acid-binding protein
MNKIFVDTSGWANLIDANQPFHQKTAQIYLNCRSQKRQMITTNYIVTELVALLDSPLRIPRKSIIAFVNSLKKSPYLEIIHIDFKTDQEAWELLSKREDKYWSLVDCSSFIIMQKYGMTEALTSDHHFEQAGFTKLLY